jgi:hypothetical protein
MIANEPPLAKEQAPVVLFGLGYLWQKGIEIPIGGYGRTSE